MFSTTDRPVRKARGARSRQGSTSTSSRAIKTKCKWLEEENHKFFLALTELVRVDHSGLHLYFNYLSESDLEYLKKEENRGTDYHLIREGLVKRKKDTDNKKEPYNPGLVFDLLLQFKKQFSKHLLQEIHEKMKNSRQRYCNKFLNMFERGELHSPKDTPKKEKEDGDDGKRAKTPGDAPTRALLRYLLSKKQSPHTELPRTRGANELDRWIWSMDTLHSASFYDFMVKCAEQAVVYTIVPLVKHERSPAENGLLELVSEEVYQSVTPETLTVRPNKRDSSKRTCEASPYPDEADSAKKIKSSKGSAPSAASKRSTRENLSRAGLRYKHMATVGGVLSSSNTLVDIKYHLYRLRTCLGRIMCLNIAFKGDAGSVFDELIVVRHFTASFQEDIIERAARTSPERHKCDMGMSDLIFNYTSDTCAPGVLNDTAIWLSVLKREDDRFALALFVCKDCPENWKVFRNSDADYVASQLPSTTGLRQYTGLDFWPWPATQVILEHGETAEQREGITRRMPQDGSVVVCEHFFDTLAEPCFEPRIQSGILHNMTKTAADHRHILNSPSFEQLDGSVPSITTVATGQSIQTTAPVSNLSSILATSIYPAASIALPSDPAYAVGAVAVDSSYAPAASSDHIEASVMAEDTLPAVSSMYADAVANALSGAFADQFATQTLNAVAPLASIPLSPPLDFVNQHQLPSMLSPLQNAISTPMFDGLAEIPVHDHASQYTGDMLNMFHYLEPNHQFKPELQDLQFLQQQISPPRD
ncbi:hypothetical protein EC988_001801 [Linderina pennispora]|nr:hypothetical protein EC988_001801 [Linderina pennispora]